MNSKKLGNIFYEGYRHVGCDTELYQRLKKKNLVEFCPYSEILHHHYSCQTRGIKASPRDEFYKKIEEYQEEDRKLLYKRQKELNFGPKVAAFCTTYNEEVRIKEFVEENLKYVDEVYISDNGSTDKTVEIAEKAGAKVRQSGLVCTPENYVEGEIKQKALEFAKESDCDWFLYLDCLPGNEFIFVKEDGNISLTTLEDLFNKYENLMFHRDDKEIISLKGKGVEILSPEEVTSMRGKRDQCQMLQKQGLIVKKIAKKLGIKKMSVYNHLKPSSQQRKIKNLKLNWTCLKYLSRRFCNKNVVSFISPYGDVSLSEDHKIISIKDGLKKYKTAGELRHLESFNSIFPKFKHRGQVDLRKFLDKNRYRVEGKYIKRKRMESKYYHHKDNRGIKYLLKGKELEAFCRVLGAYVSEGSLSKWEITFVCGYDTGFINEIKSCIEEFTIGLKLRTAVTNATRYKYPMRYLRVGHRPFWEILCKIAGRRSGEKMVPNFLLQLSPRYIHAFLDSYIKGDGNIKKNGSIQCSSNSKKLVIGLSFLFSRLNKQCSFNRRVLKENKINYSLFTHITNQRRCRQSLKNTLNETNYFYDITTNSGMFVSAFGFIPLKNCDEILEERAKDLLPIYINDQRYDSYGMQKPTFWLGRTHYRTDSDFGKYYLDSPYPLKLWNRDTAIKMAIAPRGAHSYPAINGDVNIAYPMTRHTDCELRVKHYSFDTREEALRKYNIYRKVDPRSGMSDTVKKYEHLHPDFKGITLEKWEDNPK